MVGSIKNIASVPIDSKILMQVTGQSAVQDVASAQQRLRDAEAASGVIRAELIEAKRAVRFRRVRLWAGKRGIPGWVGALVIGSASALLMGAIMILIAGMSLPPILATVMMAYLMFGGAVFWLLRPLDGEGDGNLAEIRAERLAEAVDRVEMAKRAVQQAASAFDREKQLFLAVQQAAQSEANLRLVETNRLLGVEAGRLYPDEFERYVADIFRHLGFMAEVPGKTGDQGVDVLACKDSLRLAIQAKRYNGAVGNSAIQEVYAGMAHHRCHRCVVVTCSAFTPSAITLAQSTSCLLIGGEELSALIRGEIPL